jgi:hypothetical protein
MVVNLSDNPAPLGGQDLPPRSGALLPPPK